MKILCLQLARFGDIYQTWPVLNALKRTYPDAEIHFLVRERFRAATEGLTAPAKIWTLPTRSIIEPLVSAHPVTETALKRLDQFVLSLRSENFDRIINLSFSPASSYLVDTISSPSTVVCGYTRFSDGFLQIPDDGSAYFYAQVGVERTNRIHVTDLFALIAATELTDSDFSTPELNTGISLPEKYITLHVGASQAGKVCSRETWGAVIKSILEKFPGHVVLIGSAEEKNQIPADLPQDRVVNLVGQTQLSGLFGILKKSEALVGCDSVAVQMASLAGTKTLNISFPAVRFWETGPRAAGSRILWFVSDKEVSPLRVAGELLSMIQGEKPTGPVIQKQEGFGVLYDLLGYEEDDFAWELTRAVYMNHEFPITNNARILTGFKRIAELAGLGLEQMALIGDAKRREMALGILNQIDVLLEQVEGFVPELGPVIRWFQLEKQRIGPGNLEEVRNQTQGVFEKLAGICQVYQIHGAMDKESGREGLTWKS